MWMFFIFTHIYRLQPQSVVTLKSLTLSWTSINTCANLQTGVCLNCYIYIRTYTCVACIEWKIRCYVAFLQTDWREKAADKKCDGNFVACQKIQNIKEFIEFTSIGIKNNQIVVTFKWLPKGTADGHLASSLGSIKNDKIWKHFHSLDLCNVNIYIHMYVFLILLRLCPTCNFAPSNGNR